MNLIKKLIKLEENAAAFGFQWENAEQIMQQIQSEYIEVEEHLRAKEKLMHSTLQEEIGDLLHAVFSLCLFCKLDPEQTLQFSVDKFDRRLSAVKTIAQEQGFTDLQNQTFDELLAIWAKAKARTGQY